MTDPRQTQTSRFGGLNHFFCLLDLKVEGGDDYPLLEEKLKEKGIEKVWTKGAKGL